MINPTSYHSSVKPTWCPGCGDYGIWGAVKGALTKLDLEPDQVGVVYDVGCSGNMADYLKTYAIHALHGRAIPVAVGLHLAHHTFPVLAIGGDGGIYGEGVEHFIEAVRANFNITVIVHNNTLYSLTTGQRSPTAPKGKITKSTPLGVIEVPFKPLHTAILYEASYVARGFAADIPHLTDLIAQGLTSPGFSLIDVLQPCPTWNKDMPITWYQERVYKLDPTQELSQEKALTVLNEEPEKIPVGVLFRSKRPAYHTHLPQLKEQSLLEQSIETISITPLLQQFS